MAIALGYWGRAFGFSAWRHFDGRQECQLVTPELGTIKAQSWRVEITIFGELEGESELLGSAGGTESREVDVGLAVPLGSMFGTRAARRNLRTEFANIIFSGVLCFRMSKVHLESGDRM